VTKFDLFLQQIFNGLVLGSIYALVALGYTMVYGILQLINFAHGEVVMVGAMVSLWVTLKLLANGVAAPLTFVLGLMAAVPACMLLGFIIERVAYRPLRRAPRLAPLITAIGVSIVLQSLAMMIWGKQYKSVPQLIPNIALHVGGATITTVQLFIIAVSCVLMAALLVLVNKTRLGRAMRATAQDATVAGLMGVDINRVISITFVIGSALAAVAGILVSQNYGIAHYYMGFLLGLKAFTAAVLGGIGNLAGAMLGGVLLGLIESLGAGYIGDLTGGFFGSHYKDVFAFLVLILVLVFRPSGLLGERIGERA
jgi:branched-chain amino acid transport system permease protein